MTTSVAAELVVRAVVEHTAVLAFNVITLDQVEAVVQDATEAGTGISHRGAYV